MVHFPAFLDLQGRRAVLVGHGPLFDARARQLLDSAAEVLAIGPAAPNLPETIADGRLRALARPFQAADLDGAAAVFCTDADATVQAAVAAAARAAGLPVNVADRPDLSDFVVPATVRRGDLVVAVSSGGGSPLLARRIAARIEAMLHPRLAHLLRFVQGFRENVRELVTDGAERRRLWGAVLDGSIADQVLAGHDIDARRSMMALLGREPQPSLGFVHIVGAGPGDPDLLTLAAHRAIKEADVVLHDELVAPAILEQVRKEARLIPVGRRAGGTGHGQEQINALLLAEARAGHRVVRLKAGDPFIFGRGGEELEHCKRAGVPVAVIPGITAALGCAAAAGIPLTHRDRAAALTILTGHQSAGNAGGQGETVVVYMGVGNADGVLERLRRRGMHGGTPVALIENGTQAGQRISSGELDELPRLAARHADGGPTLIVVGEVVRQLDSWTGRQPAWVAAS